MHLRMGDAQSRLGNHACFFGIFDRQFQVAMVIQSAERPCDVNALRFFHLIHQATNIRRNGKHTYAVQGAFEHVGLYARIVKRLGPLAHGCVGVFAIQQIDLFERTAIGFNSVETSHINNDGCNFI